MPIILQEKRLRVNLSIFFKFLFNFMIVFFFNRMAFDQIQAPPASKEVVESLPSIPITTEHIGKFLSV